MQRRPQAGGGQAHKATARASGSRACGRNPTQSGAANPRAQNLDPSPQSLTPEPNPQNLAPDHV